MNDKLLHTKFILTMKHKEVGRPGYS